MSTKSPRGGGAGLFFSSKSNGSTTLLSGETILCDIILIYYVCMLNAFSVFCLEMETVLSFLSFHWTFGRNFPL